MVGRSRNRNRCCRGRRTDRGSVDRRGALFPVTTTPSSVPTTPKPSFVPSSPPPAASATPPARLFLTDLDSFEVSTQWSGPATVNGQTYAHSVIECDCNGSTVYASLERRFSLLQATIGITDDAPTDTKIEFAAYSEQGLIFSRTMSFGQSAPVSIDVRGVLHLELKVVQISPSGTESLWAAWGNAELTPSG